MNLTIERTRLDGLIVFLAVAELRGFRAAARRLGMTASAVSQAVRGLEERIGTPLLSRTTRSVALTEAGERLLARARPAVDMLTEGMEAARSLGDQISGQLRICVPPVSLPLLIDRLLPDFLDLYPAVQLELVGEDRNIDIVRAGFDAGIRLRHDVEADMIAVRLTKPEPWVVIGAPSFFRRHGRPRQPPDLPAFNCIIRRRFGVLVDRWPFRVGGQEITVRVDGPLILDDVEACVRASVKGVGLYRVPRSIVLQDLKQGTLETVLDRNTVEVPGLSLYYPSRRTSLPKLRAFVEFATKQMAREGPRSDT